MTKNTKYMSCIYRMLYFTISWKKRESGPFRWMLVQSRNKERTLLTLRYMCVCVSVLLSTLFGLRRSNAGWFKSLRTFSTFPGMSHVA